MDRLWRVRKDHVWLDAQLQASDDRSGFDLRVFYHGSLVFSRRWPSRDEAVDFAARQLRDLQRAGWNTHW